MKHPTRMALAIVAASLALAACGKPAARSVATGPTALNSVSVELPADDAQFPAGPHADAVNLHCTACHSVSMVLTQPALTADQWKAEVTKMREVYKAPVPQTAVPDILAYLTAMSAQQGNRPASSPRRLKRRASSS